MFVLIDSLCGFGPTENFSESGPEWVIALNQLVQLSVSLEEFVEAAEDTTAEHYNALLESGSNELFFALWLAAAATFHIFQHFILLNLLFEVRS